MYRLLIVFCIFSSNFFLSASETMPQAEEISGPQVLLFAGSTRTDSINKKLIEEAALITHQLGANPTVIDLKDYPIPFYDGDLEADFGMPENAKYLRSLMIQSNIIVLASPEYNSSIPAVLKNVIDWASRKETGGSSRDAFKGKKFVLLCTTPGSGGGKRGLEHLKVIIEAIGGSVESDLVCIGNSKSAFDDAGHLKDPTQLKTVLEKVLLKTHF